MRRVYIPKINRKLRPLEIPTMKDRAMQALYLLALLPIAETTVDPNSYTGLTNGLSRMTGNYYLRLLGKGVAAMPILYPTEG